MITADDGEKLTIADIFEITPTEREVMTSCAYRTYDNGKYIITPNCSVAFRIQKYITQLYVCYAFHPVTYTSYIFDNVRSAIVQPSKFFEVKLNSNVWFNFCGFDTCNYFLIRSRWKIHYLSIRKWFALCCITQMRFHTVQLTFRHTSSALWQGLQFHWLNAD